MSEYALIILNMIEYAMLKKTECWICQNSECVWGSTKYKVTVQITEELLRQRHVQNTVKHLRWSILQKKKKKKPQYKCAGKGGGEFVE